MNPQDAKAYCNCGNAKVALGRLDEDIVAFDEAVRIDPVLAEAYYGRGGTRRKIGENEKARADLQQAFKLATEKDNQELVQAAQRLLNELSPLNGTGSL